MLRSVLRAGFSLHQRLWLTRAVTLGVRAIVIDEAHRVFLVRHTYVPGWYLPGGGVDRGENAETAIVRELREEGGICCRGRPTLHGFYRNGRHDHVACYLIRDFTIEERTRASFLEIAETGFFAPDALPEGTTRATRARLAEFGEEQAGAADW